MVPSTKASASLQSCDEARGGNSGVEMALSVYCKQSCSMRASMSSESVAPLTVLIRDCTSSCIVRSSSASPFGTYHGSRTCSDRQGSTLPMTVGSSAFSQEAYTLLRSRPYSLNRCRLLWSRNHLLFGRPLHTPSRRAKEVSSGHLVGTMIATSPLVTPIMIIRSASHGRRG